MAVGDLWVEDCRIAAPGKWLQGHLNEDVWRDNRRDCGRSMFHDLLAQAVRS